MKIKQCNRNPLFLPDFAYDGVFSDGNGFSLRIPEKDVLPFAEALLKAYADDMNGDVVVTMPHITYIDGIPIFVDGKVERINKKHENQ